MGPLQAGFKLASCGYNDLYKKSNEIWREIQASEKQLSYRLMASHSPFSAQSSQAESSQRCQRKAQRQGLRHFGHPWRGPVETSRANVQLSRNECAGHRQVKSQDERPHWPPLRGNRWGGQQESTGKKSINSNLVLNLKLKYRIKLQNQNLPHAVSSFSRHTEQQH